MKNKKTKFVTAIVLNLILNATVFSQKNSEQLIDFAFASGDKGFSPALAYNKLFLLGKYKKLKIGYGLRYTGYFAKNKAIHFRTAPAKLTSGKASLAAFFAEDLVAQIDTLHADNIQTNAFNLNIQLAYSIIKKFDIGFNIDAIGYTFGKKQSTEFVANESDASGKSNNGKSFSAKPTAFNLLLVSDSDIGTLNSEIYGRYTLSDKIGIRLGASFQFVEYKTEKKLAFDNDRFRAKQLLPFLAVSIKL